MSAAPEVASPSDEPIQWWPMIFSVFGLLLLNGLALRGGATALEWVLVALGVLAFMALSAVAVVSWQRNRSFLWVVGLLVVLGAAYTQLTFAGTVFLALAAHMLPWALGGNVPRTAAYGSALVALVFAGYWLVPEYGLRWIGHAVYYALTLVGQVWVVRLCLDFRRLAERAERKRISDDLSDQLGEAFSRISYKAQLAGRLLEEQGDCPRARADVAAAERICREALADVRQTIRGYRNEVRSGKGIVNAG